MRRVDNTWRNPWEVFRGYHDRSFGMDKMDPKFDVEIWEGFGAMFHDAFGA